MYLSTYLSIYLSIYLIYSSIFYLSTLPVKLNLSGDLLLVVRLRDARLVDDFAGVDARRRRQVDELVHARETALNRYIYIYTIDIYKFSYICSQIDG